MCKDWGEEVEPDDVEGLPLRFVDGHAECNTNRELTSSKSEWES